MMMARRGRSCWGNTPLHRALLLVGEGDFSFALALATAFGSGANLVASSLDSYKALKKMYHRAESNIMNLKRLGATILHGIDVQTMKFHTDLKSRRFDRIVYNFPHAGFKGQEHEVHMINLHKKLVKGFFCNARHLIRPCGEIHVSHKTGQSYGKWNLECVAADLSLILVEKVCFQKAHCPGYDQKKGYGPNCDKPFPLGTCFTFKFKIGNLKKRKKQNQKTAGSGSSIGGSTRPSHPPPLVQALRGLDFPPPANTVVTPVSLLPHVDIQRQPSGFALNFSSIPRAPYFHQSPTPTPYVPEWPRLCSESLVHQAVQRCLAEAGYIPHLSGSTAGTIPPDHSWHQRTPVLQYFAKRQASLRVLIMLATHGRNSGIDLGQLLASRYSCSRAIFGPTGTN